MGLPRSVEARQYYRAAKQRWEDAELLYDGGRTTGAIYLAGYTVECLLKALVLEGVGGRTRIERLAQFHGNRAHNLEWLAGLYRGQSGGAVPRSVSRHILRIASWSTDLRYAGGMIKTQEADDFMDSVASISDWADARL